MRDRDVRPTLQAHLPQLRLPPRLLGPVNGLWTLDAGLSVESAARARPHQPRTSAFTRIPSSLRGGTSRPSLR